MWFKSFMKWLKALFFGKPWAELLAERLHNLPFPYWLTCAIIGLLLGTVLIGGDPLSPGDQPVYLLETFSFVFALPYGLYILWYLERDARELLKNIGMEEANNLLAAKQSLKTNLVKLVSGSMRVLFIVIVLITFLAIPVSYGKTPTAYLKYLVDLIYLIVFVSSLNIIFLSALKISRVLSLIYRLRSQDLDINLLDLAPFYRLSKTTQRIALYLIPWSVVLELVVLPSYLYNGQFNVSSMFSANPIDLTLALMGPIVMLAAILVFMIPVLWIRKRIIEAKTRELSAIGGKLQAVIRDQDQFAESGNFVRVIELKTYTEALVARREFFNKVSEWPWETRVFREFLAAAIVPMILWALQLYLGRWFGK